MFFKRWIALFGLLMFFAASEDGGGVGEFDDDDFVIEDDEPGGDDGKGGDDSKKDEKEELEPKVEDELKKEIEELKQFKEEAEREKAIFEANAALSKQYPDFDLAKIKDKLLEIQKEDPEEAERLNNPVGWENLHLKYFAKKDVAVDPFDAGRGGAKEPFDFEETRKKALSGNKKAQIELFENAL